MRGCRKMCIEAVASVFGYAYAAGVGEEEEV